MGLLKEIQASLLEDGRDIGPILLKLRFLASRLGSDALEEWVKHELEGYPSDVELPDYRQINVAYKATFSGPYGSGIQNAPIPPALVAQHAGEKWNKWGARQSIASIEASIASDKSGALHFQAGDLMLLLQGHVYEGMACNGVTGTIAVSALVSIQTVVRARILDLTLSLEEKIPESTSIELVKGDPISKTQADAVTNITYNIVHGHQTTVTNSGAGANLTLNIAQGDVSALTEALKASGMTGEQAKEFAAVVASETPENSKEPFGAKARGWLATNLGKVADKLGYAVAAKLIADATSKYYGLS